MQAEIKAVETAPDRRRTLRHRCRNSLGSVPCVQAGLAFEYGWTYKKRAGAELNSTAPTNATCVVLSSWRLPRPSILDDGFKVGKELLPVADLLSLLARARDRERERERARSGASWHTASYRNRAGCTPPGFSHGSCAQACCGISPATAACDPTPVHSNAGCTCQPSHVV